MRRLILFLLIVTLAFFGASYAFGSNDHTRIAYLTFDDGPTLNTVRILELLAEYDAKATFFVLGERIETHPDSIRAIADGGHAIGLHGVAHSFQDFYATDSAPLAEMNAANESLEALLGRRTRLVRTPGGSVPNLSLAQARLLIASDYLLWDWNVDPQDSVGTTIPPGRTLARLQKLLKGVECPIILLHDRLSTARDLEEVLRFLTNEGYTLLPISEQQTPLNHCDKLK